MHAVRTSRFTWLCGASVAFSGYAFLVACTARLDQLPEVAANQSTGSAEPRRARPATRNQQCPTFKQFAWAKTRQLFSTRTAIGIE
jgi:hypothetical protein